MKRLLIVVLASATILPGGSSAGAQTADPQCAGSSQLYEQDACQKAEDLFKYMAPQLGTLLTGGNAVLGEGGTLGGFGKFSGDIRVNALAGSVPKVREQTVSPVGVQQTTYATKNQYLPFPAFVADGAIGVFAGFDVGVLRVGSLDALVNVYGVPVRKADQSDLRLRVRGGPFRVGFGGRVGVVDESIITPGIAVTYVRRDWPRLDVDAATSISLGGGATGDTISVRDLSLSTDAWRVVIGKRLLFVGFALGAGQDRYHAQGALRGVVSGQPTREFGLSQTVRRTNVFGDVMFNLFLFKVVGEIGHVSGGNIETFNAFAGKPADAARTYASFGLRMGL